MTQIPIQMKAITQKLQQLIEQVSAYQHQAPEGEMALRPNPDKWSKKEILGHLIDSAINNLQRFTEIQFKSKPYKIIPYSQEGLVRANNYQNAELSDIVNMWSAMNLHICHVIDQLAPETLTYEIELPDGGRADLEFLITDYADHMEHHVLQILS